MCTLALTLFTLGTATGGSFIRFAIGFLVLCCVIACVIILVRWLISLTGWTVPQPLLVVAGILMFLFLFLFLLSWAGLYSF